MIYSIGKKVISADVVIEDTTPHVLELRQDIIASDLDEVQALGFHYSQDKIYYSDTQRDVIYTSTSEGRATKELTVQAK